MLIRRVDPAELLLAVKAAILGWYAPATVEHGTGTWLAASATRRPTLRFLMRRQGICGGSAGVSFEMGVGEKPMSLAACYMPLIRLTCRA